MSAEDVRHVWADLLEIEINPVAILGVPLFPPLVKQYVEGSMTKADFQKACENLNVLNGGRLKGKPPAGVPLTSSN